MISPLSNTNDFAETKVHNSLLLTKTKGITQLVNQVQNTVLISDNKMAWSGFIAQFPL